MYDGLEALREVMEAALADGGMTRREAGLVEMNRQMLCRKARIRVGATPNMESFSASGGRIIATQEALEGVKDFFKKWWEKIKAMVIRFVDAVISAWAKFGSRASFLKRSANSLKEKAKNWRRSNLPSLVIKIQNYVKNR